MQLYDMEALKEFWNYELLELFGSIVHLKNLVLFLIVFVGGVFLLKLYRAFIYKTLSKREWCDGERADMIYRIGRILLYLLFIWLVVQTLNLRGAIRTFMDIELIHETKEGGFSMKVYNVFLFFLIIVVGRMIIKLVHSIVKTRLHHNPRLDAGQEFTIRKLVNYGGYMLLFLIAVQGAGFDLSALVFGSAALLLALGLGIQHIFDDFISGLILLFDGTFQVGDVIEVDGLVAQVQHIDIRTSKVKTRDGVIIVMPNRKLTSDNINNYSTQNPLSRFHVDVGVAYGSDVKLVKELLHGAALAHPDVSKSKPILVWFTDFADSALTFKLLFWSTRTWDIELMKSELRFAIHDAFAENEVQIPFPQRDLHIRSAEGLTFGGDDTLS